ncbi:MAG TPA: RDD family protein [Candidatus Binataceae bacterium]|jgi:uncharacterized RDD family membrane protein YckC|nr:RDD family protein [Candidatus Binataceae bacterium]
MSHSPGEADTPGHGLFSPEGVRLDLAIAGPAPRIIAYGIDLLIMAVCVVLTFVTVFASLPVGNAIGKWFASLLPKTANHAHPGNPNGALPAQLGGIVFAIFVLAQFVIESGYFIFWEMLTGGRSPGKALVGLRVVRRNGLPIELGNSMVRNVFRIVDLLPANYLVGLISMLLSPSGERLGDHAAGTIVIRLDRPQAAGEITTSRNPQTLSLTREQLARIGPREIELIRGTLRRLSTIPEDRADQLLAEVTETMRQRLELPELPGSDPREFLRDLLTIAERYLRE